MDKKPQISLTVGKFEPVVFFKVLSLLLIVILALALLGSYVMNNSLTELIQSQGIYRFIILPLLLAAGIAYITRHSTLKITNTGKRKLGRAIVDMVLQEGYELKRDKDQVLVLVPDNSGVLQLNQWMENMTITVRFKNQNMTLVGPRRIVRNIYERMNISEEFKEQLFKN